MDARFPPLRQWLWSILWSSFFTAIFLIILRSQTCFFLIEDPVARLAVCILLWIWLYFFFLLSNHTRLLLLIASALFIFLLPHVDRSSAAAAELRALTEMRSLQANVEAYRKDNPQQGYPAALPKPPSTTLGRIYRIDYKKFHSKPEGPADSFLLQFTPTHCECGTIRSFAITEDGKIHFAILPRVAAPVAVPATKADPIIE